MIVQNSRIDNVCDAAVDYYAGIKNVWLEPFDILTELDIGNHETEIVFGLPKQTNTGVANRSANKRHDNTTKKVRSNPEALFFDQSEYGR